MLGTVQQADRHRLDTRCRRSPLGQSLITHGRGRGGTPLLSGSTTRSGHIIREMYEVEACKYPDTGFAES